jgi:CheY-like chemotaxis protein
MRILFIENHSVFAKTVTQAFLSDHQVKVVPSMQSALKELESNDLYDLALIDYDLDDCKGDEITIKIKQLYPSIKIIATSSHSKGNNLIFRAGAHAICGKMDFKKIQSVIDSIT